MEDWEWEDVGFWMFEKFYFWTDFWGLYYETHVIYFDDLESKLDEAMKKQHDLENKVEEFEVFKIKTEESNRQVFLIFYNNQ